MIFHIYIGIIKKTLDNGVNMKKINFIVSVLALAASSLACKALAGGNAPQIEPLPPVEGAASQTPAATDAPDFSTGDDSDFPMLEDAANVVDNAGVVNYETGFSLDEVITFYRETLTSQGYTEREVNAAITDTTFNLVFDGHESGQALAIQGVDLGNGKVNVTLFLQDF